MDNGRSDKGFLVAAGAAGLIGVVAYSGELPLLALALAFPFLLSFANRWYEATLIAFSYFVGASHGLFLGVYDYTSGDFITALIAPLAANAIVAVPFAWVPRYKEIGLAVAFAVITLPPFGNFAWANTVDSAGLYFPQMGFIGVGLIVALSIAIYRFKKIIVVVPLVVAFWSLIGLDPSRSDTWVPINTSLGTLISAGSSLGDDVKAHRKTFPIVNASKNAHLVLPEGAAGRWSDANAERWQQRVDFDTRSILMGAEINTDDGRFYNSIVYISNNDHRAVYNSRVPVPYFMTRDRPGFYKPAPYSGLFKVSEKTIGGLICYEAYISWPLFQTMLSAPDEIVVVSNLWWAKRTNLRGALSLKLNAYSLLFNKPFTLAYNE